MNVISQGLDKAEVLLALWNAASANLFHAAKSLSKEAATQALDSSSSIDYLAGKPLKIDLSGNTFSTYLYNCDNGENKAQKVIEDLRKKS